MKMQVLLVEDNPVNSELVSALLEADGHHIDVVADAASLRAYLARRSAPDLVLMDILLPDASGTELLLELRSAEAWPGVPIVAITAQALAGDAERLRAAGFDGVLTKPIQTRGFVATLLRVVGTRRNR